MRLKEFLTEQQLDDIHDALDIAHYSLPYTYKLNNLKNQDFYEIYRFGLAIAAVRGESGDDGVMNGHRPSFEAESQWGENQVVSGFDPNLGKVVDQALKKVNKSGKKVVSTPGSDEMEDTNSSSPLKPFKGYKR